jgi:C1A family cysteine protease
MAGTPPYTLMITVLLLVGVASARADRSEFSEYKLTFNKLYSNAEAEAKAFSAFQGNVQQIEATNSDRAKSYIAGLTRFSDLTPDEFRARFSGSNPALPRPRTPQPHLGGSAPPAAIDWVDKGAVTAVKNQEQCASCWAFATTGALEAAYFIKTGKLVSLSEQQLVTCYRKGCSTGDASLAFRYLETNALCSEASYPYTPPSGKPYPPPPKLFCEASNCTVVIPNGTLTSYVYVTKHSEEDLLAAVAINPVVVSIDANTLQNYRSGVMSGACSTYASENHAVLVVGYGDDSGSPYWKIKNSWGATFGESGYFRVQRNDSKCDKDGGLGILSDATYAVLGGAVA